MEVYSVKNLTFTYPSRSVPALNGLTFSVNEGEFVTLCGLSGCGKTTLLRHLKPSLAPHGIKSGEILFEGKPLDELDLREHSQKIGFVMQSPENQIVTDKVWHELAFGLESLGMQTPLIRRRVAEIANFFGIEKWFYKNVTELSGGQKQILNLASIMAMQPSVLIPDEPTSRLDPIAAAEFLDITGKINRELGITVILTEHRLEEVFPHSDRVIVMNGGSIIADGMVRESGAVLRGDGHGMFAAMPVPMRVYAATDCDGDFRDCPVTVREGKDWLEKRTVKNRHTETNVYTVPKSPPAIEFNEVWFKYEKNLPDILKGLSFRAHYGEIYAILGGNGTGKTTSLSLASGINKAYRGKVKLDGKEIGGISSNKLFNGFLGVLPQNPECIFVKKTVEEDLAEIFDKEKLSESEKRARLATVSELCGISELLGFHPYDLSGGEQQRAALAKVLLLRPKILLLDEPTKGLDAEFKREFADILRNLANRGVCIVIVSHDIEFCAEYVDRCALFFDGNVVSEGGARDFFSGNNFYTTSANRMARRVLPEAITANDIIRAVGGTPFPENKKGSSNGEENAKPRETPKKTRKIKIPVWRMLVGIASGAAVIASLVSAILNRSEIIGFVSGGDLAVNIAADSVKMWKYVGIIGVLLFSVIVFIVSFNLGGKATKTEKTVRKLSKRTVVAAAIILFVIPLTVLFGVYFLDNRKYYFIGMLIILETMIPFAPVFERRKPQARELIVISVLCAVGVAGRTAFFMLPQFKPVAAAVIIAGMAFGGESGFLVGAVTGFVSNMFFGQGPWTPWQMFAFGVIGFLAGVSFHKGILARSTVAMCVFGFLSVLLIYGGIMNPAAVLMFQPNATKEMFFIAYLQGLPFDLVHALATVFFLAVAAKPMLEKLDRIKIKYGLTEP